MSNRKEGKGETLYADGSHHSGFYLKDLPHGKGRLEYANKDTYEGDFFEGAKHG